MNAIWFGATPKKKKSQIRVVFWNLYIYVFLSILLLCKLRYNTIFLYLVFHRLQEAPLLALEFRASNKYHPRQRRKGTFTLQIPRTRVCDSKIWKYIYIQIFPITDNCEAFLSFLFVFFFGIPTSVHWNLLPIASAMQNGRKCD